MDSFRQAWRTAAAPAAGTGRIEGPMSTAAAPRPRDRKAIPDAYKWRLEDIYPDWASWSAGVAELEAGIAEYTPLKGTLAKGAGRLLAALRLNDRLGSIAYKAFFYPSLRYDEDQRDNDINARRQQVQALFARWQQATSWINPELLTIPLDTVRGWMAADPDLAVYRFAIEEVYRQQEHVLDERGEHLLSLGAQMASAPGEAYQALSTADAKFPEVELSTGERLVMSYGNYRAVLATNRNQADRRLAFLGHYGTFAGTLNTYASLYHAVCQRDRFTARARGYPTTLDAALFGDNVPRSVVDNLIATTRAGVAPLQRYHRLRRRALRLDRYYPYDFSIPLVTWDRRYRYDDMLESITASVAPLGADYQARLREGFAGRWIDVYENDGKRSGAYSAAVYGVHPYMLLNWADTLDDVFTLAHEMGHSMHTLLAHERQPFVYSDYTIFVAEVPSTLSETLLLEHMLERAADRDERIVLLQHAIDNITSTFYTQVMFADFELAAHERVEQDQPLTADVLNALYRERFERYYGDAVDMEALTPITWARIPHFFGSPYYVYQYATCFASAARIAEAIRRGDAAARDRYLDMLAAGGSDHPMTLLKQGGADLSDPTTVQAVVDQLDRLVGELETLV